MGRPIKAHHIWQPVNRSNWGITFAPSDFLVKNTGKPVKPAGIPVGTVYTCDFEFGFEFNRFPPVSGQTGPVNRYWRAAV